MFQLLFAGMSAEAHSFIKRHHSLHTFNV